MKDKKNPKTKKRKRVIIAIMALIAIECAAIILSYNIYVKNSEAIVAQFNKRQYLIAREVGFRISDFFENVKKEMNFMDNHPPIISGDSEKTAAQMRSFYDRLKDEVLSFRRLDEKGIVTHIFSENPDINPAERKDESETVYFQACKTSGKPFLSDKLAYEDGKRVITLALPLLESTDRGEKIFKGIISCDISLNWITENFVSKSQIDSVGYLTIIDANGTLLSEIKHPEMIYNNIFSRSERCFECHTSFETLEKMVLKGDGIFRYRVKGEKEKYLAASTVSLPGAKWIIAFNIPVSELQAITNNMLVQTGMLIILIIATIAMAIFLVFRVKKDNEISGLIETNLEETVKTKEMLENIIQSSVDGILIVENTGMMTASNDAAKNILGYSDDEFKEMHTSMLASPDNESLQKRREALEELFEKGRVRTHETLWKRKNGDIFPVESTNSLIKDAEGNFIGGIIIFRDVTERKQLQEALVNAQRLSAVGEIGITVKHEINNPLGGIIGYSELILKHKENLTEKDQNRMEEIHKMAIRIRDVINKIETIKEVKTVDYVDGIKMVDIEKETKAKSE